MSSLLESSPPPCKRLFPSPCFRWGRLKHRSVTNLLTTKAQYQIMVIGGVWPNDHNCYHLSSQWLCVIVMICFHRWETWDSEGLSNFPKSCGTVDFLFHPHVLSFLTHRLCVYTFGMEALCLISLPHWARSSPPIAGVLGIALGTGWHSANNCCIVNMSWRLCVWGLLILLKDTFHYYNYEIIYGKSIKTWDY